MTAERQACISRASKPSLARGARLDKGKFIRSLPSDGAPKRFARDANPPDFGHCVKPHEWRWEAEEADDGLSVNMRACANTLICAILLHPKSEQFKHVVVIDLPALVEEIEIEIVAVYDPDPCGTENPCHFNLIPVGKSVNDLKIAIKNWHRKVFPSTQKAPHGPQEVEKARLEHARYSRVFEIHRDVSPPVNPALPLASVNLTSAPDAVLPTPNGRPEVW